MAMEEGELPRDLGIGAAPEPAQELDPRAINAQLSEHERQWSTRGDGEALWEEEHELLIKLQRAGDINPLMKRARKSRKAMKPKGPPVDLAQAALSLWVLERFDEAEEVLRAAVSRLPGNRYPWSLLLRHLSWDRDPFEAIAFVRDSLPKVPWKAFAYVQLGTLCIDAASRAFKEQDWDACDKHLGEARTYLGEVSKHPDFTQDMARTVDRLTMLVDTLDTRVDAARRTGMARPSLEETIHFGAAKLEKEMREVAEASGVRLEGEPDEELDLDELERAATFEVPEEPKEESYTVLEVTPKDRLRKRRDD
jgi:tetratricopeptide (TPR) repeat protein